MFIRMMNVIIKLSPKVLYSTFVYIIPLWVPQLYWIYFVPSNIMIFFMVLKPILPNFWIHLYQIL